MRESPSVRPTSWISIHVDHMPDSHSQTHTHTQHIHALKTPPLGVRFNLTHCFRSVVEPNEEKTL